MPVYQPEVGQTVYRRRRDYSLKPPYYVAHPTLLVGYCYWPLNSTGQDLAYLCLDSDDEVREYWEVFRTEAEARGEPASS